MVKELNTQENMSFKNMYLITEVLDVQKEKPNNLQWLISFNLRWMWSIFQEIYGIQIDPVGCDQKVLMGHGGSIS